MEEEEEEIMSEEEEEEEEEELVDEGIGRKHLQDFDVEDIYEETERIRQESKVNLADLKSGIESLLQGSASVLVS